MRTCSGRLMKTASRVNDCAAIGGLAGKKWAGGRVRRINSSPPAYDWNRESTLLAFVMVAKLNGIQLDEVNQDSVRRQ